MMAAQAYTEFLRGKRPAAHAVGIAVDASDLPAGLFDYQRHCTIFALKRGRAGIFLDTGLGKTAIELAFADRAARETGLPSLILCPLAVAWQIVREAQRFGIEARVIREKSDVRPGVNVCNYDRLDKLDLDAFGAVALDEASILKSYTGKTTRALIEAFASYRFRLTATATPAPNDHMELGQQSQFLGVMDSNEMLMRWFIADQTQMGRYRLKGHGERDFYDWMASWSRMAESPEDLGFDGSRFKLPPLEVRYHRAETAAPIVTDGLFASAASATEIHDIKRQTNEARAELACELAAAETGPIVIWCDTDYEADALKASISGAVEVRGSQSIERKEEVLRAFADGEARILITKPVVAGYGLNWQHCARMIYAGRSFSYEQYYQSVRRCWRYGQKSTVVAHIITAEGEEQVAQVIGRKSDDHRKMKRAMCEAMRRAMGTGDSQLRDYVPTHQGRLPAWFSA